MDRLDGTEIWRTIPPEEKLDGMNRAHSMGILSAAITIIICSTIAVGLKMSWVMWGAFLCAPFIFQFSAGKAWRDYRPRLILEYLAARSAARRYAFASKSKDLTLSLIFRGEFAEVFDKESVTEALEAALSNNNKAVAWIALFSDVVIVMTEQPGGARLQFASQINERLAVETPNANSENEYRNTTEVLLSLNPKKDTPQPERRYKITSHHPAALVVFQKKLLAALETARNAPVALPEPKEFDEPPPPEESMEY